MKKSKERETSIPAEDFGQLYLLMMKVFGLRADQLDEKLPDDFLQRLGLTQSQGDQEEGRSPYTTCGVRQMLEYWRVPCTVGCKGWRVIKDKKRGVWVEECEDCVYGKNGCIFPELTTCDIEQLPEVWQALVDVRAGRRPADVDLGIRQVP